MSGGRVVVVGGGLAGIRAALSCADRGAQVTLLEGRSRLGGATWSKHHRGLGLEVDNGQHVFMRCCDHYIAFLERLGVRDQVTLQEQLAVAVASPGAPVSWIRSRRLPAPAHLAQSLLRYQPIGIAARVRAGLTARGFSKLDPDDPRLDERSLGEWLEEKGEGDESIDRFWDLLIRPTLNIPAREASLSLATKILRTGFLDNPNGADVGWSKVPLAKLHAEPASRALAALGVDVRLNARIDKVEPSGSRGAGVWAGGHYFEADAVIVAVPHEAAAGLLPPSPAFDPSALRGLGRSAIVNLHVVFDRRVMHLPFVAGVGTELQWIFDRTETSGLCRGQYLTVSLSAGEKYVGRSVAEMRRIFLPEFEALFANARGAQVESFAVMCDRSATFRQAAGSKRLRPNPGALGGGIFIAGAWTDTGWPATMEGAVRSGEIAADDAMRSLVRGPLHDPLETRT